MVNEFYRKKILSVAEQILNNSLDIVQGCRQLDSLYTRSSYAENDKDFLIIKAVASETDEFPVGEVRKHYDDKVLEKLDKELNEYLGQSKSIIFQACENIIKKYSNENHCPSESSIDFQ